ncbi:MAG: MoxR-like ATPase, partial [Pseudonocardiales bacterium]|nr:MoxR-like ATPase [Pseudonocardiales bacterium]
MIDTGEVSAFRDLHTRLGDAVESAVRGKRDVVDLVLVAMFAGGHVLLEDVPGTGKTTLARAVAGA